ncbi:30S ribosome-binding factor RbfA [candidate division NPL-UPA2 bacterium Unc8]|uniref:Ribosome-binding factor A n=1 Tax=candidate division NPL-UPA2 bacterium Unc8 TaxID=1980939 RepID=A0A399G015_UNCN2|nr:Ribosome-binding factor A [Bacillota bacterium]MBT9137824.1 Ribosome-binding factor A [Bacillota bacterium]MBT9146291.1 Ribosome-binding factor A [Bacillota bacterium]RII00713.1 MAG: 30S ribosome-binding factor RbfA [candidate division NPL-UPA2 bacterium Unc8]
MSRRTERVAAVIKEEVSRVLEEKVVDSRIGFVTITAVEVSSDLRCATIFVSTYLEEKVKDETIYGLRDGSNYIRRKIGKKLHLRYLPKLTFKIDNSIEKGTRVEDALKQINKQG